MAGSAESKIVCRSRMKLSKPTVPWSRPDTARPALRGAPKVIDWGSVNTSLHGPNGLDNVAVDTSAFRPRNTLENALPSETPTRCMRPPSRSGSASASKSIVGRVRGR